MAQLKDLIVNGASRLIGDAFANKLQITTLADSANSIGTNGQVLKSDGSKITWTSDISITGNAATATTATKLGTADVGNTDTPIYLNDGTATQTWTLKSLSGANELPASSNLNTYITPGNYAQSGTADARTDTNTPYGTSASSSAVAYRLTVETTIGGKYKRQIYENYNDGLHAERTTTSDGASWTGWRTKVFKNSNAATLEGGTYLPVYIAKNGQATAITENSVLTDLSSTTAASTYAASPRPGVTGTLPISNGGTGATTLEDAKTNLQIGKTLTIGSKTYNGSSDTTIEIADLGLAGSNITFKGIITQTLTNEGTTSPVTYKTGGSLTPTQGDVVIDATGKEYIWTNNKWENLGLATDFALSTHIHGNILNNGTITSDTAKASGQHLVITDSNNKICRSALKLGTSSTSYLCNNGTWATPVGDRKVNQLAAITTAGAYPVILACSTATTAQTAGVNKTTTLTYNPSTTKLHTPIVEVTNASYGGTLPSSGTTGQLFFQTTSDYYEIPTGGTTGQALIKNSNSDRDIKWGTIESGGVMTPNSSAKYYVTGSTSTTQNTDPAVFNTAIYVDGGVLYGAAWNDYAEFRQINNKVEYGRCVVENGDDTMSLSAARLQPGAEIISDTYGFIIGAQKEKSQPVATSGRVLAYPYEGREEFKNNIGKPVCSGPNGTVSIMTNEEYQKYGYLAIGTISAIPEYEYWGENNVKVDNRVWIRVK